MKEEVQNNEEKKLEERVLLIRRVSKKTAGGNHVTFSALVAVGDTRGKVGIGIGRAQEVPSAIQKGMSYAKKHMITVPLFKSTIAHRVQVKHKAAVVLIKPAPLGTGLKVGSVVRIILELVGVQDASGKILGSRNQVVNTYTIMKALKQLKPKITKNNK